MRTPHGASASSASPAEAGEADGYLDGATLLPEPAEVKLPPAARTPSKAAPAAKLRGSSPPPSQAPLPKRPPRREPSRQDEPGAPGLRRRPTATRRRLSGCTPRCPRAGKFLPSESPGFPAASGHRGLFTRGPDPGRTGSRRSCPSDTFSSEWPADQSPCAGVLFGSSALRPFGSSALAVAGPSGAFRRARKLSSPWFNFPFWLRHFRVPRRSGSPRVPEGWVIQVLRGEAKLPKECFRESYVERGRLADSSGQCLPERAGVDPKVVLPAGRAWSFTTSLSPWARVALFIGFLFSWKSRSKSDLGRAVK